ncbi:MAG: carboxypeptidase-like regulatory domain-containing protein [Planctomycetota bacterium]
MNRKFATALVLGLLLLGALLFFLNRDSGPDLGGENGSSTSTVGANGDPGEVPDEDSATVAADDAAVEDAPKVEVPEPVKDPLLIGKVSGEGAGIAGANVLLFPVNEIEKVIERIERLVPTGGTLPDVPKLFNGVKAEFARFRKKATVLETDAEGMFRLDRGAIGGQYVLTYADGWLFAWGDVVSLQKGRTHELNIGLTRGSSIGGRVVNSSGAGVSGVEVIAEYSPAGLGGAGKLVRRALKYVNGEFLKGPFTARSGPDGSFELDSLIPGVYDVVAKDPRGVEVYAPKVETGSNHTVILLGQGASVEGTLVDTEGIPVAGVQIQLERQEELLDVPAMFAGMAGIANILNQYLGEGPRRVVSAESGKFRFAPLGAGRYKMTISQRGFLPLARDAAVDWNETNDLGEVAVYRGKSISGIVRSTDGKPLHGAEVVAFKAGGNFMNMGGQLADFVTGRKRVKTDRDGTFVMSGLGSGKYALAATFPAHGADSLRSVEAGLDEDVEFQLEPGIYFTGRVVSSEDGEPIRGVRVSAGGARVSTDADGRFELDIVAGGADFGGGMGLFMMAGPMGGRAKPTTVAIEAAKKGFLSEEVELELAALPADLVISLPKAPQIRGIVRTPDGEPAPGALVRLTPAVSSSDDIPPFIDPALIFFAATVTDLEGRFKIDDYFAPFDIDWEVIADHLTYTRGSSRAFNVEELSQGEIELEVMLVEGASVTGKVMAGGSPVAGATVRLSPQDDDPQAAMMMNMLGLPPSGEEARTNNNGEFEFTSVKADDYKLVAEMVGFVSGAGQTFSLAAGQNEVFELVLDPGQTIVGRVVDIDDQPLAAAQVSLLRASESEEILEAQRFFGGGYKVAKTDERGRYKFQGLEDGEYSILVTRDGFSKAEVDGVSAGLPVGKIVLIPAGDCRVVVADAATGSPVITFTAGLERTDVEEEDEDDFNPWRDWGQEVNDTDGIFEKAGLEPGSYSVTLRAAGYLPATANVEIEPGGVTEVSVDLARAGRIRGKVINKKGAAIVGAGVVLEPPSDKEKDEATSMRDHFRRTMMGMQVETDERGEFVLDCGPEDEQTLVVTHDDYIETRKKKITVVRGEEITVNVTMEKGLSISGAVRDQDGNSVRRYVWLQGLEELQGTSKGVFPDEDGTFTISGLAAGKYRLRTPGRGDEQSEPLEVDLRKDRTNLELIVSTSAEG